MDIGYQRVYPPSPRSYKSNKATKQRELMIAFGKEKDDNSTISQYPFCLMSLAYCRMSYGLPPLSSVGTNPLRTLHPLIVFCYMNLLKGTNSITRCSGELTKSLKSPNSPKFSSIAKHIVLLPTLFSKRLILQTETLDRKSVV